MQLSKILLSSLLVGAFGALIGSGCMASSPRREVVYAGGYQTEYVAQQPAVVVAQPTYVQPTYVQPSYGYYAPSRVVVAPARGYYRGGYYGGRGYYAPRGGYYAPRGGVYVAPRGGGYYAPQRYYGPRPRMQVAPAPGRQRGGAAVYVR